MAVYTRNAHPKVCTVLYTLLSKSCRYLSRAERERERMTDVNSLAGGKVHI